MTGISHMLLEIALSVVKCDAARNIVCSYEIMPDNLKQSFSHLLPTLLLAYELSLRQAHPMPASQLSWFMRAVNIASCPLSFRLPFDLRYNVQYLFGITSNSGFLDESTFCFCSRVPLYNRVVQASIKTA